MVHRNVLSGDSEGAAVIDFYGIEKEVDGCPVRVTAIAGYS